MLPVVSRVVDLTPSWWVEAVNQQDNARVGAALLYLITAAGRHVAWLGRVEFHAEALYVEVDDSESFTPEREIQVLWKALDVIGSASTKHMGEEKKVEFGGGAPNTETAANFSKEELTAGQAELNMYVRRALAERFALVRDAVNGGWLLALDTPYGPKFSLDMLQKSGVAVRNWATPEAAKAGAYQLAANPEVVAVVRKIDAAAHDARLKVDYQRRNALDALGFLCEEWDNADGDQRKVLRDFVEFHIRELTGAHTEGRSRDGK